MAAPAHAKRVVAKLCNSPSVFSAPRRGSFVDKLEVKGEGESPKENGTEAELDGRAWRAAEGTPMAKRPTTTDAKRLLFNNITQSQEPDSRDYSTKGKASALDLDYGAGRATLDRYWLGFSPCV